MPDHREHYDGDTWPKRHSDVNIIIIQDSYLSIVIDFRILPVWKKNSFYAHEQKKGTTEQIILEMDP